MAVREKRRLYKQFNDSGDVKYQALTIRKEIAAGEEHSYAHIRLILSDPLGQIPPDILLLWLAELEEEKLGLATLTTPSLS